MKFLIVLPAVFFLAYAGHSEHHADTHAVNAEAAAAAPAAIAAEEKSAIAGAAAAGAQKRGVVSSYNSRPNTYSVLSSGYQQQNTNNYAAAAPLPTYNAPAPSNSYSNSHSNSYAAPSNTYAVAPSNSYSAPVASSSYSSSNSYVSHTGYLSVCQKRLNLLHNINKELSDAIVASQGHCANVVTLTNATAQVDLLLLNSCGGSSSLYGAKSASV